MDGLCLNILLLNMPAYIERNTLVLRTHATCTSDAIHYKISLKRQPRMQDLQDISIYGIKHLSAND